MSLLDAERASALGPELLQIHHRPNEPFRPGAIHLYADPHGDPPELDPAPYDALITAAPAAPAPWVTVEPARFAAQLARIEAAVRAAPHAAAILSKVLRIGEKLAFDDALELESLAYSTLLGGGEFACWLAGRGRTAQVPTLPEPVHYERDEVHVTLTLDAPQTRNEMTAAMRDALYTALANVLEDPSRPNLLLTGAGRCFSTGGFLPEFGSARDLAAAHTIRTLRSPARLLHRLAERGAVHLNGAAIGSGIELAAAAYRRTAAIGLIAQLPELAMGLIPGAGGTVTLPRAIGRHRTAWLALGAFRIGARQALDWGLVHEVVP